MTRILIWTHRSCPEPAQVSSASQAPHTPWSLLPFPALLAFVCAPAFLASLLLVCLSASSTLDPRPSTLDPHRKILNTCCCAGPDCYSTLNCYTPTPQPPTPDTRHPTRTLNRRLPLRARLLQPPLPLRAPARLESRQGKFSSNFMCPW